jgi:hypothetical protein
MAKAIGCGKVPMAEEICAGSNPHIHRAIELASGRL